MWLDPTQLLRIFLATGWFSLPFLAMAGTVPPQAAAEQPRAQMQEWTRFPTYLSQNCWEILRRPDRQRFWRSRVCFGLFDLLVHIRFDFLRQGLFRSGHDLNGKRSSSRSEMHPQVLLDSGNIANNPLFAMHIIVSRKTHTYISWRVPENTKHMRALDVSEKYAYVFLELSLDRQ